MTMAIDGLHIFIFPNVLARVWMTIFQYGYGWLALSVYTDGMKRLFIWELPVGYLTGVATAPTAPDADMIPTLATLEV